MGSEVQMLVILKIKLSEPNESLESAAPGINWVGAEVGRTPDELQPPRSFLNETRETQPGQCVPSQAGVRGRRRDRSLSRRSAGFSWLHDS